MGLTITEPEFINVEGAQEWIPRNRIRQAGNRFLGPLKGLQIRAQVAAIRSANWERTSRPYVSNLKLERLAKPLA